MDFFTVTPIETTFLRVFDKPRKVRLNKKVIDFNYAHLSPYQNGGHVFFQTDTKIYVWYLAKSVSENNAINIPEAYLLYRFFRERRDAVILLTRNCVLNALVMRQGELCAQTSLHTVSDQKQLPDLLKREYSLTNPEIIQLDSTARFPVKPADLLTFTHFELKPSELMERAVSLIKVPLIVSLLITSGFTIYQSTRLESALTEKKLYLERLKKENAPLLTSLEQGREQGAYWREFIFKEQSYPDFYLLLAQLTDTIHRHDGYLNYVDFGDNRLTIWAGLKTSEATIIKELLATGLFQDVKLLASNKDFSKPDFNLYNLLITLRPPQKETLP